jgi:hypothetical protein
LFKSQNASTWSAEQKQDLMFTLFKCNFDITKTYESVFESVATPGDFDYDKVKLVSGGETDFGDKTDIQYSIASKVKATNVMGGYIDSNPNTDTYYNYRHNIDTAGDSKIKLTLKTTNKHISPIVDKDGMGTVFFQNQISSKLDNPAGTGQLLPEELPTSGSAIARYITRTLTLKEGFDATGIRVILDIYRPQLTSIEVFVRAIAATDPDDFDNKHWIPINMISKVKNISRNKMDYLIDEYTLDNINYDYAGVTYADYRTFAVKVVMYSDNPSLTPVIKNFRAIATS